MGDDTFNELVTRIESITGLGRRQASTVAIALTDEESDSIPTAAQIVDTAVELGYDVDVKHARKAARESGDTSFAPDVEMDPNEVFAQVHLANPGRLIPATNGEVKMPRIGLAPQEAMRMMDDEAREKLDELRDEAEAEGNSVFAALTALDLSAMQATVWIYDEANGIDRPIGPIDLTRYSGPQAFQEGLGALMARARFVLTADWN